MRTRSLALVITCLSVVAGCAHAPITLAGTPPCPSLRVASVAPATGWHELSSRHFVMRTDIALDEARDLLDDFERSSRAFEELAFSSIATPAQTDRIELVLFSSDGEFRDLAPRGASAYFLSRQAGDLDQPPAIAMHYASPEITRRRFQHELTHRLLDRHVPSAPPWLEEGLAQYYSTLAVTSGHLVLGALPVEEIFVTEVHTYGSLVGQRVETRVDIDDLPSVAALVRADYGRFADDERGVAYYGGAWAFVHMLTNGPDEYRRRFAAFIGDLVAGRSSDDAWLRRFGNLSPERFEHDFRAYVLAGRMRVRRAPFAVADAPTIEVMRPLGAGEVRLLRARLRPWDSRENIVAAGEDLAAAVEDPEVGPDAYYWRSLYHRRWRRFAAAETALRGAIARAPSEPRYWYALVDLLDEEMRETRAPGGADVVAGASASASDPSARLAEALAHLAATASSGVELDLVARHEAATGDAARALDHARRAVRVGDGCWVCRDTLATLGSQLGLAEPPPPGGAPLAYARLELVDETPPEPRYRIVPAWERWMSAGISADHTVNLGRGSDR